MELPDDLKDNLKISGISINSYRVVEDQSRSTTRKLVDTLEEHDALEHLIDESKPKMKLYNDGEYFKNLHYLLMTPFRYPPLKWGSRFGLKHERSLFYSAASIETAMAEKAFYLLAFLNASDGNTCASLRFDGIAISEIDDRYRVKSLIAFAEITT